MKKLYLKTFSREIIGVKLYMDSMYIDWRQIPITILKLGPCIILDVENSYVRILFENINLKKNFKFWKKKLFILKVVSSNRYMQKTRFLFSNLFKVGDYIDIVAKTKGRGFSGVIKRWGFSKQPQSHGSMSHRRGGSFGNREWPAEIQKGKKMPGHFGFNTRTNQNLLVVGALHFKNLIFIKGSVPGSNKTLVRVKFSIKKY